jgi:UDP-glucose 4-epimerase
MTRVLLTGASGFVGSRVTRHLVTRGVPTAVLLRESSNTRRIDDLLPRCTVIRGELANLADVREAVLAFEPTAIIHLAWNGVKSADRNSLVQMHNVAHSISLFQLAVDIGCRNFVGLGSQAEYGPQSGRISEHAPTRPTTAYGAAKLSTGLVLERAAASRGICFAWLRLFSSYGPDDDPNWLIPYLIGRLLAREIPSLTRAEQIWDYIHVDDAAAAVVAILDAQANGMFNLGSGIGRPLRETIELIRDCIDPSLQLGFGQMAYRHDQVMHLEADCTELANATGWRPQVSLEVGINDTVKWYREQIFRHTK